MVTHPRTPGHFAHGAAAARGCRPACDNATIARGGASTQADDSTDDVARELGDRLRARGLTLATAESCTGGLIGALVTALPGSSAFYLGGVVAYADAAKVALLGVAPELLARDGAVSATVARAMAEGIRRRLGSDLALAVTGIAGPAGGTPERPVGLVYVALATGAGIRCRREMFDGDRAAVRRATAVAALSWASASAGD